MKFSKRAHLLKPSQTLAMTAKAKELQASGKDVVSLTVGEPDWQSSEAALQAASAAIEHGKTKYTPTPGILELRQAIAKKTQSQLGLAYTPQQVFVGTGAKFVIFAALQMLVSPGDEVIIPAPYWVSYPSMVELAGGKPIVIACGPDHNFKLTPGLLKKCLTEKTRALILCAPNNPTGIMYSKEELKALADVLIKFPDVWIISDDIYNELIWTGDTVAPHILNVQPVFQDRTLVVNGVSKSYAMTGWRIGWGLGPLKLMTLISDYASQSTSNAASISQYASLGALMNGQSDVSKAQAELKGRYQFCESEFQKFKFFKLIPSQGAFYLWVDVQEILRMKYKGQKIESSKNLAEIILNDFLVATVPGSDFGSEGYLRLSFAASKADLTKAFERFADFEKSLLS